MTDRESPFIDRTGKSLERPQDQWPPYVIPKEAFDLEIERLADLPAPNNGRRESYIAHPRAKEPGLGLAPGIRVSLSVLKPGERTKPFTYPFASTRPMAIDEIIDRLAIEEALDEAAA